MAHIHAGGCCVIHTIQKFNTRVSLSGILALGIAAAAFGVGPAAAQQKYTLIAASFAISERHPAIVAMWSTPQSVPVYNSQRECLVAGQLYSMSAQVYIGAAANILGAGVHYQPYTIAQCEPTGDSPTPGATLQFNIATGIGNMALGSNGNVISLSARIDSAVDCETAKADLGDDFHRYLMLLPNRVSGPFCY
jgi:hypothetical protein